MHSCHNSVVVVLLCSFLLQLHVLGFHTNKYVVSRNMAVVYSTIGVENGIYINNSARIRLQEYFDLYMKTNSAALLRDFDTYRKSLPVREGAWGVVLPLYLLSYYVLEDELVAMATELMAGTEEARKVVKYVAAPSRSGKTASILPAFLRTDGKLTHYLYLAFSNNNDACFAVSPSKPHADRKIAENQGAAFIFECVKRLLNVPDSFSAYIVPLEDNPRPAAETSRLLKSYLIEKLGSDSKPLFHLDEHKRMCDRQDDLIEDTGRDFSRGAMKTLASISNVAVVATYVDPPLLHGLGSASVCRYPVIQPRLDINWVMEAVLGLSFPYSCKREDAQRRLASLKLRLAMKVSGHIISFLHLAGSAKDTAVRNFIREFREGAVLPSEKAALNACMKICRVTNLKPALRIQHNAGRILLGKVEMEEKDENDWSRDIPDLVLVNNGDVTKRLVTSDLRTLLTFVDPVNQVFNRGRNMFRSILTSDAVDDYLSSNPLEVCYAWVLATESALCGSISFTDDHCYSITCKDIIFGRIFPTDTAGEWTQSHLDGLRTDVLYMVDERRKGQAKHQMADLFFLTEAKQLVLVSVTGSGDKTSVQKRRNKLEKWIQECEGVGIGGYSLHGALLAPFFETPPPSRRVRSRSTIADLHGLVARDRLGGLGQIANWFKQS